MNSFFRGTMVLIVAAFFSECVEFFINMILARELKEAGMGLYMSITPIIFLIMVIASFELPVSISKFIAEHTREHHYRFLLHAIRLALLVMIITLILTMIVLSFPTFLHGVHPYIKWLIVGLIPIMTCSSIARGYFIGVQQMGKIALSNFLRKIVQFTLLFFIFHYFQLFDQKTSLLIALSVLIASEFIVFLYLISLFILQVQTIRKASNSSISRQQARKKLLEVSMPTTILRIFHSITHAIQPFLIQSALIKSGFVAVVATEHFGMLTGVAMTIGFFPAFIAHSLMIMIIPNVADAYAKQNHANLRNLLQQSMSFTMLYGIPAVVVMYLFAEPLTALFFSSSAAALYLKLLCPYFLFHFFVIPLQAYLIGLGLMKDAFFHTVWSHIISFSLMYFLGSQTNVNMIGIILGMNTGAVLLALMHYVTICKKLGITFWLRDHRIKVY